MRACVPDTEESRGRGAGGQGHPLQRWSGDRQAPGRIKEGEDEDITRPEKAGSKVLEKVRGNGIYCRFSKLVHTLEFSN